ncbi:MAG: rhodanese-like domain-containing protein [Propionicimonas sp.]|uniref:rhodanese-like domain-containing protein n=1 Tax=Propionicimonas sp. TaxID=1955623 RepID=UPI002B210794|nr:rhodanese-like domain-containing protein [Propionicimonas sp.]MEA4945921.1 rhodanese-like domain-containing protein [Propionicimonas sp.]MEA5055574.1 rhodanese-like domain-containing protein [Propionicimonas sp.]
MPRARVLPSVLTALLVALFTLAGCAAEPAPATIDPAAVIIDVRTPAEYAEGHLEGAINLDVQADSFAQQLTELAGDGTYVVYCRSGRRSAQAAALLQQAGLTVTDAGSMEAAAKVTGLKVVTD